MQEQSTKLSLTEWLRERRDNCNSIATSKSGEDRIGWLDDADYFQQALECAQRCEDESRGNQMWRL